MQKTTWFLHFCIVTLALMAVQVCDARGGRRGGSMGGAFGSWRKYKKHSSHSGGSSRRIVSSSPVHTPITKALNDKKAAENFGRNTKISTSRQQTPQVPTGGSYHSNTATLPVNAVYLDKPPPRGSDIGSFLNGALTGQLVSMVMPGINPINIVSRAFKKNYTEKVLEIDENDNQPKYTQRPLTVVYSLETTTENGTEEDPTTLNATDSSVSTTLNTTPIADFSPPPYGIICVPILVNETDSSGKTVPVEHIFCYPAPAPETSLQSEIKSEPVEVAGDIVES